MKNLSHTYEFGAPLIGFRKYSAQRRPSRGARTEPCAAAHRLWWQCVVENRGRRSAVRLFLLLVGEFQQRP